MSAHTLFRLISSHHAVRTCDSEQVRTDTCLHDMYSHKRTVGDRGEAIAVGWLRERGYEIVDTNVQIGRNEIDVICRSTEEIVFVEVKSGSANDYGHPIHRIDRFKRRAIVMAALRWLMGHPQGERGVRFDVMSIVTDARPPEVDHRQAAFTADDI